MTRPENQGIINLREANKKCLPIKFDDEKVVWQRCSSRDGHTTATCPLKKI